MRGWTTVAVLIGLAACQQADPLARARADCGNDALAPDAQIEACQALTQSGHLSAAERGGVLANSGAAHARAGDTGAALRDFASALGADDGNVKALQGRARILIASGQLDAAEPLVDRLLASGAAGAEAHLMQGEIAAARSDYVTALNAFDAAQSEDPHSALILASRARMKEALNDNDGAMTDFTAAISMDRHSAEARSGRCWLAIQQNRDAANDGVAREDAEAAVAAAPHNFNAQSCLGILALRAHQWPQAKQAFDAALDARAGDPLALFGRGVARHRDGDGGGVSDMNQARDFDHHIGERFDQLGVETY